jgi:hypothetical protein
MSAFNFSEVKVTGSGSDELVKVAAEAADHLPSESAEIIIKILSETSSHFGADSDKVLLRSIKHLLDDVLEESGQRTDWDLSQQVNSALVVTWPGIEAADLVRIRRMAEMIFALGKKSPTSLIHFLRSSKEVQAIRHIRLDALKLAVALSAKVASIHQLEELGDPLHATLLYPG